MTTARRSWGVSIQIEVGDLSLDLDLAGGPKPVAIIGPNGSGKTTLLRTIAGAHQPKRGIVQLGDQRVFDSEQGISLAPEERSVGYVPQGSALFPHLDVVDNVGFGCRLRGRSRRRAAAVSLLQTMGSGHLVGRSTSGLSGGEQQRVALARALMIEPQLLLLDEPLSALDATARRSLRTYLRAYLDEHELPAIVVLHDARDVRALGASVVVIEQGTVVSQGSAEALASDPKTEFIAEFFGA